jgi:eukaryotic-like serine/threonine-protein kinase
VTIGEVVAGKYRVERLAGEGGMGVVVAARHLQLDTVVALKLLPDAAAADPVLVERFLREARAAARLRSDHVAKVLDVGTLEAGTPFMVMEYLDGANLADVLSARGRLDPETACDYVLQACDAVAEAHSLGIVHRDLKPENLYLTTRFGGASLVKVLDFGVSKTTAVGGALTTTCAVVGSPMYMAPEQMRASRVADPRSDVWALGVVLYELLTERCPFEAESLPDLCLKISHDAHRPIADLRPGLPSALAAIVERCLEKDPALRFADAAELASALEPFAPEHSGAEATDPHRAVQSLAETMAEPVARGWSAKRVASLGALVTSAVLLAVVWTATRPRVSSPSFVLAAVDAVRWAESFAPEPEPTSVGLAPPPASAPAHFTAPPPRTILTVRAPHPPPPPPPRPDDDIPAYR